MEHVKDGDNVAFFGSIGEDYLVACYLAGCFEQASINDKEGTFYPCIHGDSFPTPSRTGRVRIHTLGLNSEKMKSLVCDPGDFDWIFYVKPNGTGGFGPNLIGGRKYVSDSPKTA